MDAPGSGSTCSTAVMDAGRICCGRMGGAEKRGLMEVCLSDDGVRHAWDVRVGVYGIVM